MSKHKQITIIGATGNLGVPVAKNLISFGYQIKMIVRDPEKAQNIFGNHPQVEIVLADLTDVPSLKKALKNTAILYLNLSTNITRLNTPFAPEREGMANILEAVDHESIRQIIVISGLGAFDNVDFADNFKFIPNIIRKQGHKLLKNSGIPFTILHCTWFADSFVLFRRKDVYGVIGDTHNPVYFTNAYDYTRHIDNAVGNEAALHKEFPVQGTHGIPHPEAAKKFFAVYNPKVKVKPMPGWILSLAAVFSREMKFVKHMSDYFNRTKETFVAKDCNTYEVLGKPQLSIEEYAKKLKTDGFYDYLSKI